MRADRVAELTAERDRETYLRRKAEKHNAELRAALEAKLFPDEMETADAEVYDYGEAEKLAGQREGDALRAEIERVRVVMESLTAMMEEPTDASSPS